MLAAMATGDEDVEQEGGEDDDGEENGSMAAPPGFWAADEGDESAVALVAGRTAAVA